jgi:hypothetical protein
MGWTGWVKNAVKIDKSEIIDEWIWMNEGVYIYMYIYIQISKLQTE